METLRPQTVDPEVRAYISSLVTAVGGQSTLTPDYEIGDSALAVLGDILRWIRLYDDKTARYDVKRCLADLNFVKGDLLPIVSLWREEEQDNKWKAKLALSCLQLLVTLMWPMEVSEEKTKVNHLRHMPVLQLAQVAYKRAILHWEDAAILRTVVRIGLPAMAVERRERSRRDEGIIMLMLHCFKNVTMITQPQHLPSQGDENEVSRSATIEAFKAQGVFDLLLAVGSGARDEFQDHDVVLLETLFHLLKGIDARKLFLDEQELTKQETDELQNLLRREKAMLDGYNRHAPTRHNRFGTMVWVKTGDHKVATVSGQTTITNSSSTLRRMDASKKYDKPRQRGKQAGTFNESEEIGGRVDLTDDARAHLRGFVEDFLDSSFNPLFSSLRKAIERDDDKIAPSNYRQFWYLISWFLNAEAARRDRNRSQADRSNGAEIDNTFAYIAAVLDQETFVLLNRQMQRFYDERSWQDLRSTLVCFTQILCTVQNMAESKYEEDQEIAENIQNRIFYEEATQDRIVQICRTYSNQGLGYLDAVTECVHVFVRMLETYSKQNVDLQIRSKRRARRRKKEKNTTQQTDSADAMIDSANAHEDGHSEDEREVHLAASERKFDFARFSAKFLSQGCVDTFISLTHYHTDLTPAQLKRCHRFFYRLAFKQDLAVLLFRVDILLLFQEMVKGSQALDTKEGIGKEWRQLVEQVFRRCIKWLDRETEGKGWKESAVVEMLFSKIPATLFYLQNGYEREKERRAPRAPALLEVKPSVKETNVRVAVAVSLMLERGLQDGLDWAKTELEAAARERQSWKAAEAARTGADNAAESGDIVAPTIVLSPDTDERKQALFKDKILRLLLTTLGLERMGASDDPDASWIIPSDLDADMLMTLLRHVQNAEHDPPIFPEEKNAQDLIRTHPSARRPTTFDEDESSAGDSDIDGPLFPANLRHREESQNDHARPKKRRRLTKRNSSELSEEQAQAKMDARRKREKERNGKIKSALFVTESDDESDEERDVAFFRLEEARRMAVRKEIGNAVGLLGDDSADESGSGIDRRRKKPMLHESDADDDDDDREASHDEADTDLDSDDEATGVRGQSRKRVRLSEPLESGVGNDQQNGSRPVTAANVDNRDTEGDLVKGQRLSNTANSLRDTGLPLSEVSGNATVGKTVNEQILSDDEDDVVGFKANSASQRRKLRAGFVIESDDDD